MWSLVWLFAVVILYAQMVFVALAFLSPTRLNQFLQFSVIKRFTAYLLLGTKPYLLILVLLFLDSLREITKYSHESDPKFSSCANEVAHMKQFRAQRNYYITGFSLFLCFIIWRLVSRASPAQHTPLDTPTSVDRGETVKKEIKDHDE